MKGRGLLQTRDYLMIYNGVDKERRAQDGVSVPIRKKNEKRKTDAVNNSKEKLKLTINYYLLSKLLLNNALQLSYS